MRFHSSQIDVGPVPRQLAKHRERSRTPCAFRRAAELERRKAADNRRQQTGAGCGP